MMMMMMMMMMMKRLMLYPPLINVNRICPLESGRPLQWSYSVRVHIVCVQGLALKWLFEPVDAFRSHLPHSRGP